MALSGVFFRSKYNEINFLNTDDFGFLKTVKLPKPPDIEKRHPSFSSLHFQLK
ncbi:Uncharacterized protein dnm_015450 [Desulfonema magnum]|uniref:Uncharacterized protein n=1 Tax=Desulfonema magnum TaxID=45655 RepID=A0A975BGX6_9BACT|nr:Uncharacterized protein dnm_015450 [Desulfonema magnum]